MNKILVCIVEQIYWNLGSISTFGIHTTCINALEEINILNYKTVLPFLLEEYNLQDAEPMIDIIEKVIVKIQYEIDFTTKVVVKYKEIKEKIKSTEKKNVLREISQFFAKNQMQNVYNSLVKEGLLK